MIHKTIEFALLAVMLLGSCYPSKRPEDSSTDFGEIVASGQLTVVTLNSSTTYFQFKMQPMGYEYDLIADFAKEHKLTLNIKVAENETRLIEMLQSGEADVAAYPVQIDSDTKHDVLPCGHERQSYLVIVQRVNPGDTILNDVTQLIGKEVYVNENSTYHQRLENLDGELGGGINIMHVEEKTVTSEDLIEMVSTGIIPYTVSEANIARLSRTYFRNINIDLEISFKHRASWVVRKSSPLLAAAINEWASNTEGINSYQAISKRYFERSKDFVPILGSIVPRVTDGKISPFDGLFKKYAQQLGWDWQLLASIAYQESNFDPTVVGWSSAEGLMGIMPRTAAYLGFADGDMQDPEKNIRAGVDCLEDYRQALTDVTDTLELIKLTLAAYNAGIGHINDARQLALKYGKDPNVWDNNVAEFIRLKSEPQYYTDPVCKHGYLRGRETYKYVPEVLERYNYYKQATAG
ncbi:MAG: transglycosylase SLT domain-containing protein [Tannerella sp.]|jgi:membrane-bound lytic murein transglycosylase F|nr:transglycosylase SLT domain-containing protein [Tannerella sp.]